MSAQDKKIQRLSGDARRVRSFAIAVGASLVGGLIWGGLAGWSSGQNPVAGSLSQLWLYSFMALALILAVVWASLRWWRNLDELARQAHYSAWFWGGSIGMFAACLLLIILPLGPQSLSALLTGADPELAAYRGGMLTLLCGCVGYGVAWSVFWARRR